MSSCVFLFAWQVMAEGDQSASAAQARSLSGSKLLRRGPPTYLRELTDKLETKAASTLGRLQSWPVYDALQAS